MGKWDALLSERDRKVFEASGFGKRGGHGQRPVILVVDVNINFIGDKPEPILESIKRWRHSCGQEGWDAVHSIKKLLDASRRKGVPVIYSTGQKPRHDGFCAGRWADKNARTHEEVDNDQSHGNEIPPLIAPQPQDVVIEKLKPSPFFGTPLAGFLIDLKADTVIVCGTTTSGCVRAAVVDAFSYNFRVAVVEECCFDRGEVNHQISLFDMNEKYADVVELNDTLNYLESLPDGLFLDSKLMQARGAAVSP